MDTPDTPDPNPNQTGETRWSVAAIFVSTLYFIQGLPYVIVNQLSVVLYKTLGVSNATMAFWTSWLGLIWAFKAFWSPFVDGVSTKRRWTVAMQLAMAPVLLFIAATLPLPWYFEASLLGFFVLAFLSATHDIAADGLYMVALRDDQQSAFVGVRSTAWRLAPFFGESVLIYAAGALAEAWGSAGMAWSAVLASSAGIFGVAALWHYFILPTAPDDVPRPGQDTFAIARETVKTFVAKSDIGVALLFIGFFRFAENHMAKLLYPFLLDPLEVGGLGLSPQEAAIAKGTVGLGALTLGGILGGLAIYRDGLKAWLWPMALAINVPNLVYVYLAWAQPQDYLVICTGIGIESFGYGFGFTAYMMYLIKFADGPFKTAHYAFATGLMALAVSLASFWSGYVQEQLGYLGFFVWVVVATLPGFLVTSLVNVPADFGRRRS
ncbi:MAG: MFS transporter [Myxococcota bacterium]